MFKDLNKHTSQLTHYDHKSYESNEEIESLKLIPKIKSYFFIIEQERLYPLCTDRSYSFGPVHIDCPPLSSFHWNIKAFIVVTNRHNKNKNYFEP